MIEQLRKSQEILGHLIADIEDANPEVFCPTGEISSTVVLDFVSGMRK